MRSSLAIVEAMKIEHTLTAPIEGTIVKIAVTADAQVAEGARVTPVEAASAQA